MTVFRFFVFLGFAIAILASCARPATLDLLIREGQVIDGTGSESYRADVGLRDDKIVYIGLDEKNPPPARRVIEAEDYVVTPGFIDPHTHCERDLLDSARSANLAFLHQGVTTVVIGNDGGGPTDVEAQLKTLERIGTGTNAAVFIGHNRVRRLAMGMADRPPTDEEMEAMKKLVARGMEAGALGLSAGLFYSPGQFSDTEEIIDLAKVAARYGGIYDVHLRDESSYSVGLLAAVRETIRIAEEAGIHANISHIKALGADVWGQSGEVTRLIREARARGLALTADQYPYRASSTGLAAALLPRWVFADDPDYRSKLKVDSLLAPLSKAVAENLRRRGGPESILLTVPTDEAWRGLTLAEIAARMDTSPVDAALEVLRQGNSRIASFNMRESDIEQFMRQPWVMTCSDGGEGHPRKYGSFPRKIQKYVLERGVLTLEEMVHRSTQLTATTFRLEKRGRIAPGYYADLLIFKPEELRERATFDQPSEYAEGMHYVIVNGEVVIDQGRYNGKLPGKALRRAP